MATIQLSKDFTAIVDDDSVTHLEKYKWHVTNQTGTQRYYANGEIPARKEIDHISRDTLDNRLINLRVASRSENNVNSKVRCDNTTGYKGVYYVKGRGTPYWAYVKRNGKRYGLGMYKTAEEASKAYQQKAKELYGDFAS